MPLFGGLGLGFLSGYKPDLDGNGLFRTFRFRGWNGRVRHRMCVKIRQLPVFGRLEWRSGDFHISYPGYAPNLSAYLFGNILTISLSDIIWIAALAVVLIAVFSLYLREIVYVAF